MLVQHATDRADIPVSSQCWGGGKIEIEIESAHLAKRSCSPVMLMQWHKMWHHIKSPEQEKHSRGGSGGVGMCHESMLENVLHDLCTHHCLQWLLGLVA